LASDTRLQRPARPADQTGIAEKKACRRGSVAGSFSGLPLRKTCHFDGGIGNAGSVEAVAGTDQHAVFLHGDDLDAGIQFAVFMTSGCEMNGSMAFGGMLGTTC
jgi:hypothetical protein